MNRRNRKIDLRLSVEFTLDDVADYSSISADLKRIVLGWGIGGKMEIRFIAIELAGEIPSARKRPPQA